MPFEAPSLEVDEAHRENGKSAAVYPPLSRLKFRRRSGRGSPRVAVAP